MTPPDPQLTSIATFLRKRENKRAVPHVKWLMGRSTAEPPGSRNTHRQAAGIQYLAQEHVMRTDVGWDPCSLCSSRPLMHRCLGPVLEDQSPAWFSVQPGKKKAVYLVEQKTRLDYGPQGLGLGTPARALFLM